MLVAAACHHVPKGQAAVHGTSCPSVKVPSAGTACRLYSQDSRTSCSSVRRASVLAFHLGQGGRGYGQQDVFSKRPRNALLQPTCRLWREACEATRQASCKLPSKGSADPRVGQEAAPLPCPCIAPAEGHPSSGIPAALASLVLPVLHNKSAGPATNGIKNGPTVSSLQLRFAQRPTAGQSALLPTHQTAVGWLLHTMQSRHAASCKSHLGHLLELQDAVVRLVAPQAFLLHLRQQVHLCSECRQGAMSRAGSAMHWAAAAGWRKRSLAQLGGAGNTARHGTSLHATTAHLAGQAQVVAALQLK